MSPTAKFCSECAHPIGVTVLAEARFGSPDSYTPRHLAEKILRSRAALEGERKQVTVLFADLKGSMESAASAAHRSRSAFAMERNRLASTLVRPSGAPGLSAPASDASKPIPSEIASSVRVWQPSNRRSTTRGTQAA